MTDNAATGAEIPAAPVVVFDGHCNLCNFWVAFLLVHDRRRRFRFATLQGNSGQALLRRVAVQDSPGESIVLVEDDRAFTRSSAALRILQGLGLPWAFAGVFRIIPRMIRDGVYDLIARNRYRWFGRTPTCRVPTAEERALFLDPPTG